MSLIADPSTKAWLATNDSEVIAQRNTVQTLYYLPAANMQSTADQAFRKIYTGTNYKITEIFARQR